MRRTRSKYQTWSQGPRPELQGQGQGPGLQGQGQGPGLQGQGLRQCPPICGLIGINKIVYQPAFLVSCTAISL